MTGSNDATPRPADDDQASLPVSYGHGRMPFFMKVAWILCLVFFTYYVAVYLIPAAGEELAK